MGAVLGVWVGSFQNPTILLAQDVCPRLTAGLALTTHPGHTAVAAPAADALVYCIRQKLWWERASCTLDSASSHPDVCRFPGLSVLL